MKRTLIAFTCMATSTLFAQTLDQMEHNNTSVSLERFGNFFYDDLNSSAGFEVPKNSGEHYSGETRVYFMGKDSNGNIHASLGGNITSGSDVSSGPYSDTTSTQAIWYDRAWQLCQEEIDIYSNWWEYCVGPNADFNICNSLSFPSNELLTKIYNWPPHGDESKGESYFLAPYYDHPESAHGVYDPDNGDYPIIKGCCATWRIENDVHVPHTVSNTDPIGIEMQYFTYQYKNYGVLNDVTLLEVMAINRGTTVYPEFVYGLHSNVFIGATADDRMGSDSLKNMYFCYNADDSDALYGSDPAVFGIVALEDNLTSISEYSSSLNVSEIWNVMNGNTSAGQPIFDDQNNVTQFEFHDSPTLNGGWSQESLGLTGQSGRGIMSNIHGSFVPGDTIRQTYAFVYVKEGTRLQSVDALYAAADELHTFYDTISMAQCEGGVLSLDEATELVTAEIKPNPASEYFEIEINTSNQIDVELVDMQGRIVLSKKGTGKLKLEVSNIPAGSYLVHVASAKGILTEKMLIIH